MTTTLNSTRHVRALNSLSAIDEALVRLPYELRQCEVLRREAAYLAGLLYETAFEQLAVDLRGSVADLLDMEPAQRAARAIREALVQPFAAHC
ncbi:hypothetical protein ACFV9C_41940 [Kribbella sp. NPDC059898]|uniref:hypothetical protein n=1 Tax=Kribbella sp. NPDC059898 TaxID=3346995 RepID=UPI00365E658C